MSSISPVVSPDHPGARGDLRLSEQEIVHDHVPPSAGEPQSDGPSGGRTIVTHEASGDAHALDIFQEQSASVAVENRAPGHVDPPTAPQNQGTLVGQGIEDLPSVERAVTAIGQHQAVAAAGRVVGIALEEIGTDHDLRAVLDQQVVLVAEEEGIDARPSGCVVAARRFL